MAGELERPALGFTIGESIGGFRIESLLGRGGMGAVYLATHERLQRKVALKVLVPELAADAAFRERFIRESQLAALLEHPNVIPIYDADEVDGVLYLAMRYVEGSDLRTVLDDKGMLAPPRTVAIVEQVAAALDAAHGAALVHRDVKPANILLAQPGSQVYLSDFGLAKQRDAAGLTRTGTFMGSVDYCAPEQIEGLPVDGRADIYALGSVLHHCLAGQPPYPRDSEVAVIKAHLIDPPPPLSQLRPDLPASLDSVIATALAKAPDDRYATAGALSTALRSALSLDFAAAGVTRSESRPIPAAPPPTEAPPPAANRSGSPSQNTPPADDRSGRKRAARAAAIASLLVAAALAAAVVSATHRPTHPPSQSHRPASAQSPLAAQIAPRVDHLAARQRVVNRYLREQPTTPTTFAALAGAARALRTDVVTTQGFEQTLAPETRDDRAIRAAFATALDAHLSYANALTGLPTEPSALTASRTGDVVATGDGAHDAYTRLRGTDPQMPLMPISHAANTRLQPPTTRPHTQRSATLATQGGGGQTAASPPPTTSTGTSATTSTQSNPGTETFQGQSFAIIYPRGWRVATEEASKPGFIDTTIRNPADPDLTYIRVDYTPQTTSSLEAAAGEQRRAHRLRAPGYHEIRYDRTELAGFPAIQWEFEERQPDVLVHKIDTFVIDDRQTGFAILTQARASSWARWAATFDRVTASFAPHSQ